MGVGRIRSICHAFDRPPRMCHAWVWVRGCVGARLRCAIISFDKRVYICCLAASCRKRYIVRHRITGVTGDSRPYVLYMCSYYVRIVTLMLHLYHFDGPT